MRQEILDGVKYLFSGWRKCWDLPQMQFCPYSVCPWSPKSILCARAVLRSWCAVHHTAAPAATPLCGLHTDTVVCTVKITRQGLLESISSEKFTGWFKITKCFESRAVIKWKRLAGVQGDRSSAEWPSWGKVTSAVDLTLKFQWPELLLVVFGFPLLDLSSRANNQIPKVRWEVCFFFNICFVLFFLFNL